jgi:hypothetical protein
VALLAGLAGALAVGKGVGEGVGALCCAINCPASGREEKQASGCCSAIICVFNWLPPVSYFRVAEVQLTAIISPGGLGDKECLNFRNENSKKGIRVDVSPRRFFEIFCCCEIAPYNSGKVLI